MSSDRESPAQRWSRTAWPSLRLQIPSWLLLLVGLVLVLTMVMPRVRLLGHHYSQPVAAQVIESTVVSGSGPFAWLCPRYQFSYRYVHQGRVYYGSAYRPVGGRAEAVRRHPPGQLITAHVDPQWPERSMVEPGIRRADWLRLLIGLCLLLIAGLLRVNQRLMTRPR